MKIIQVISILLLSLTSCNGDTIPDMKIIYSANWNIGEKFKYKVTKTKEDVKFGYSGGKYEMTQIGILEVTNKTDEEYELEWKIIKTIYPEGVEMDTFYTRIYEDMMKTFRIKYTTDKNGQFKKLINWEDILNFQFETMDNISEMIEEEKGVKYKEIKTMMRQMLSSKEQVEAMFIQEIKLLHSYYGSIFNTQKVNLKEKYIPNIFDGEEVLLNSLITVKSIDTVEHKMVGQDNFELNENIKNEILKTYIESLEKKYGKGSTDVNSVNSIQMEIKDITQFDLNYSKGIANRISYKRIAITKSEIQDLNQVKEIIIEKIE